MGGMKVNSCVFVACNHPYMPPQPCPILFHGPVQMTFTTNSSGITVDLCTAEKLGRGCSPAAGLAKASRPTAVGEELLLGLVWVSTNKKDKACV